MKNIIESLKLSLGKGKWINLIGISFIIHFFINFLQFMYKLFLIEDIKTIGFNNGVFSINHTPIGHDINSSFGFVFLIFLALIYYRLKKQHS